MARTKKHVNGGSFYYQLYCTVSFWITGWKCCFRLAKNSQYKCKYCARFYIWSDLEKYMCLPKNLIQFNLCIFVYLHYSNFPPVLIFLSFSFSFSLSLSLSFSFFVSRNVFLSPSFPYLCSSFSSSLSLSLPFCPFFPLPLSPPLPLLFLNLSLPLSLSIAQPRTVLSRKIS